MNKRKKMNKFKLRDKLIQSIKYDNINILLLFIIGKEKKEEK